MSPNLPKMECWRCGRAAPMTATGQLACPCAARDAREAAARQPRERRLRHKGRTS